MIDQFGNFMIEKGNFILLIDLRTSYNLEPFNLTLKLFNKLSLEVT